MLGRTDVDELKAGVGIEYGTFEQLADYAKTRAIGSARRNGHQEFAYWIRIFEWASILKNEEHLNTDEGLLNELELYRTFTRASDVYCDGITDIANVYAKSVHIRKMLITRGLSVPRLSLQWLRDEAAKYDSR